MNSLGWSRSEVPANTAQQSPLLGRLQRLNPFSDEGFVRLPTREGEGPGAPLPARTRREEEEGFFARESTPTACAFYLAPHFFLLPWRGRTANADGVGVRKLRSLLAQFLHPITSNARHCSPR